MYVSSSPANVIENEKDGENKKIMDEKFLFSFYVLSVNETFMRGRIPLTTSLVLLKIYAFDTVKCVVQHKRLLHLITTLFKAPSKDCSLHTRHAHAFILAHANSNSLTRSTYTDTYYVQRNYFVRRRK
jgi:hypothetical protein